jgi:putative ABC transport system permease protein
MFRNYLKIAFRYLLRNKGYTTINILGLAIGIACCLLIMLFVRTEFSYDRFHSKSDRIYRLWQQEKVEGQEFINTVTPVSAVTVIQSTYPEVETTCRVYGSNPIIKVGNNSFTDNMRMVDSTFFTVFDFELLEGNRANPFSTANTVLLTEETAIKYFGKENAMGKSLEIQFGPDKVLFTVGGIVKSAPEASSIRYNLLIPYANSKYIFGPRAQTSWFNVVTESYVVLKEGVKAADLQKKFTGMIKKYLGENYKEGGFLFHLQPMTDIHLNNDLPAGLEPVSNPKYSYILGTIGILILLVACINFIILSVGRSATRAMEVGVRKVMGAERQQLVRQFWGEAILVTMISVVIGLIMSLILLKPFNQIVQRNLTLNFIDPGFLLFCLLMIGLIALIAGMYPALVLSGFKPVDVLKGKLKMKGNNWMRQGLIVGQFVASIAMIVCTIAVGKQMNYLKNKDLGYQKEQVVIVSTNMTRRQGLPFAELYRSALLKQPQVKDAAVSIFSFGESGWANLGFMDDKRVYKMCQYNSVDAHFIKAMGLTMNEGRDFSPDNPADFSSSAIVNEAFVKEFGFTDPVGKKLPGAFDQRIVGVVKDFNYMSLHSKIEPLFLTIQADSVLRKTSDISFVASPQPRISVRLQGGNLAEGIEALKRTWKEVAPNQDFEYRFLDESIAEMYQAEQRTSTVVKIASGLSIFIACMGLFGLATLTVVRRTKEIGIRKVLGADTSTIVGLLSKDFAKLVILAAIIAFPLAWWFMNDWLKDFAYRTSISWWVYVIAGVLSLVIALGTISFQAIKAALANPVKSLRTE